MNNALKYLILTASILLCLPSVCADTSPKREMRAVWIATVYRIDWPSAAGTDRTAAETQKRDMRRMLDRLKAAGFNAVSFQVRSMCDALYKSSLEPWSASLTGERGKAPAEGWDPLAYCVKQAHARGMECHAWINPFRFAVTKELPSTPSDMKIRKAGMLLSYTDKKGKKTTVLDPGNPDARQHVVSVCREIVENYDIDGIMFDDYFYPDRIPLGRGYDYDRWKASGTKLSQADWRRANVNLAIAEVYDMIQLTKPYVRFGVSPAGVGGGNGAASSRYSLPPCYNGNDWMYDRIFCDPLAWLEAGSVDYISPQIYWTRDNATNPYEPIARWWSEVADRFGCHFYASHSISSLAKTDNHQAWEERGAQIDINRANTLNSAPGSIFYSARYITSDAAKGFGQHLAKNQFRHPAIPPAIDWKDTADPGEIHGLIHKDGHLTWDPMDNMRFIVYAIPQSVTMSQALSDTDEGYRAEYIMGITYTPTFTIPADRRKGYRYVVAPLDRYGNEWAPVSIK